MAEYIDKDKAIADLRESAEHHEQNRREWQLLLRDRIILRAQPAIDVAPVVHAKWIEFNWNDENGICHCGIKCSKCLVKYKYRDYGKHPNYCPHCGAKMGE